MEGKLIGGFSEIHCFLDYYLSLLQHQNLVYLIYLMALALEAITVSKEAGDDITNY